MFLQKTLPHVVFDDVLKKHNIVPLAMYIIDDYFGTISRSTMEPKSYSYTSTTFSDALQIHMMTHTGGKPYVWPMYYTCIQTHKLQKQKMTHTGQKAHKYDHSFTCMWGLLGLIFSTESLPCLSISVSGWTFWNLKHCVKTSYFLLNDAMFWTMFFIF